MAAVVKPRLSIRYDSLKAAQVAAFFLVRHDGELPYIKLIKSMYLADREALVRRGRPITGDRMLSMDQGPVLGHTLDAIRAPLKHRSAPREWAEFITEPANHAVRSRKAAPETDALSSTEVAILTDIDERFGSLRQWEIVDWTHSTLPEWCEPFGTAIPIDPADILRHAGWTAEQIDTVVEDAIDEVKIGRLLAR
jgi:uncharacterized phage-associated protein